MDSNTPPPFDPTQPHQFEDNTSAPTALATTQTPPPFDPGAPHQYEGDTTAALSQGDTGIGSFLGGLGRPAAGQDQTVIGRGLSTIGSMIHGAGELARAPIQAINKLDPGIMDMPWKSDPDDPHADYEDTAAGRADQVSRAKSIEGYQQDYNLARPGTIDKQGNNTSPDVASDLTQGALSGLMLPESKAVGYFPELAHALGTGVLASLMTPTEDQGGTQSASDFLGDKGKQALVGALAGTAGKTLGDVISPNVSKQTQLLLDKGVTPTMGQIMRTSENPLIKGSGEMEALSTGLPLVGGPIRAAQDRAVFQLNKAVGNSALSDADLPPVANTVKTGADVADDVHDKFSDAYDKLVPNLVFDRSPEVPGTSGSPAKRPSKANPQGVPAVPATPAVPDNFDLEHVRLLLTAGELGSDGEKQFNNIIQNSVTSKLKNDGTMTGEDLKGALSDLRKKYKGFQGSNTYNEKLLGDHLEQYYDAMKDNMVRHSAPEDVAQLAKLDKGYTTYAGITRPASAKASNQGGTYTPAQMAMVSRQADTSTGKGMTARGKALQQPLAQAANAVLTKLPDSFTAGRMATGKIGMGGLSMLAGGAHSAGFDNFAVPLAVGAGLAGGASAAYSAPGQQLAQALLTGRQGTGYKAVSDAVQNYMPAVSAPFLNDEADNTDNSTTAQMNNLINNQGGQ